MKHKAFLFTAHSNDESNHSIGITQEGTVYTWGKNSGLGKLGRPPGDKGSSKPQQPLFSNPYNDNHRRGDKHQSSIGPERSQTQLQRYVNVKATRGYVGGTKDAGHSAVLDENNQLWVTGCDRWQQLGLGSASAGAAGYTWKDGALWQESFQRNDFILELMKEKCGDGVEIKDVAIGGDHTVVLADNKKDVFTFGKGSEGQLGLGGKPFVSSPVHSKELSSSKNNIASVCAIRHCSFTLGDDGEVLQKVGRCRFESEFIRRLLQSCHEKK